MMSTTGLTAKQAYRAFGRLNRENMRQRHETALRLMDETGCSYALAYIKANDLLHSDERLQGALELLGLDEMRLDRLARLFYGRYIAAWDFQRLLERARQRRAERRLLRAIFGLNPDTDDVTLHPLHDVL